MKAVPARWILAFAGAIAFHAVALGMVPWSKPPDLGERTAGAEADVWGAPTNAIVMDLATVETIAGEAHETAEPVEPTETAETAPETTEVEDVADAEAVTEVDDTAEVEPMDEPREVAALKADQVSEPEQLEATDSVREVEPVEEPVAPETTAIDPDSPLEPVREDPTEVEPTEVAPAQPEPEEVKSVAEPVPTPTPKPKIAKAEPEPSKKVEKDRPAKTAKAAPPKKTPAEKRTVAAAKARGNAAKSASAPSGVARGNNGRRQTEGGWSNKSSYARRILAHLERHKHYPQAAVQRRLAGVATLTFSISAKGQLRSVSLRGSSGESLLDEAALSTVRRAAPFPPIPAEAGLSTMTFTVPLRYKRP